MSINKPLKILYLYSGDGSGEVYRGIALSKALARRKDETATIDLAVFGTYENLVIDLPNVIFPTPEERKMHYTKFFNRVLHQNGADYYDVVLISLFYNQWQALNLDGVTAKAWLMLYDVPTLETFMAGFKPEIWQGIFIIEPTTIQETVEKLGKIWVMDKLKNRVIALPMPVVATWPDEIITDPKLARARLIKLTDGVNWEQVEGLPLVVFAQNGMQGELEQIKVEAQPQLKQLFGNRYYTNRFMSQRPETHSHIVGYTKTPQLETMFAGIDMLVSASGYNTFWGWVLYGKTRVIWLPRPMPSRSIDDQFARAASSDDPYKQRIIDDVRNTVHSQNMTGADSIISRILDSENGGA